MTALFTSLVVTTKKVYLRYPFSEGDDPQTASQSFARLDANGLPVRSGILQAQGFQTIAAAQGYIDLMGITNLTPVAFDLMYTEQTLPPPPPPPPPVAPTPPPTPIETPATEETAETPPSPEVPADPPATETPAPESV